MENLPSVAVQRDVVAADLMPLFDINQAIERRNAMVAFVQKIMVDGRDYGTIPGTGTKPSLLKPGAEKLVTFFGLSPEFDATGIIEDFTGKAHDREPFFFYRYKCRLTRNGRLIGEGEGSCNSFESKYRYRWVPEDQVPDHVDKIKCVRRDSSVTEFAFAVDKAETGGQYGKPAEYWKQFRDAINNGTAVETTRKTSKGKEMAAWQIPRVVYQVPNRDVADVVNTVQKMAQKRALVAAVLVGVNASEFFTQDVEDMEIIDVTPTSTKGSAAQPGQGTATAPSQEGHAAGAASSDTIEGEHRELSTEELALANDESDTILKFREIDNMGTLTQLFNDLTPEQRKPNGKMHVAFKLRMAELTTAAREKSRQRTAAQPGEQG